MSESCIWRFSYFEAREVEEKDGVPKSDECRVS